VNNRLAGQVVFITGASSGIGKACAKEFAAAGARLILTARRLPLLQEQAESLREQYNAEVCVRELDVADKSLVKQVIATIPTSFQDISILVNNAGLAIGLEPLQEGSVEEWEEMIHTNVLGLLYLTREVVPLMVTKNKGHVINIGSISSHRTYKGGTVYCATKHAVTAISRGLKQDLAGTRIRVSSVDPGAVETNFSTVRFHGDTEKAKKVYEDMEALTAQDIAEIVLFTASRPPHVNMSEIVVLPTDQRFPVL
jgi:3-hydroxy acid dehydrogenase / malonic semialdehyde reductase